MNADSRYCPELLVPLLADLAAQARVGEIPVRGTSMFPSLLHGDKAWVVPTTAEEVRIGDVVLRLGETGPMVHRVVGWWWTRHGWRMLTKGDGARWFDPPVHPDQLVGRVVALVRDDQVQQLEGMRARVCGRIRAATSFTVGAWWEVWVRGRRTVRRWLGSPED
ncbi:MAG TPA: S24/S26 family peptidase [Candidatus Acidoferrum sp.]|nr:S24/S26 family peptidase [Candidatus Acidoferrum sp.]